MKEVKQVIFLLFIVMVSLSFVMETKAINTGFETSELESTDKEVFLKNVEVTLFDKEPSKKAIECFDVNERGMIALGQKNGDKAEVCIYNSDGDFQYGYDFQCRQDFAIEWDETFVSIYFVRSDVLMSVDESGDVVGIEKVENTIENNSYRNRLLHSKERIAGDMKYVIRNKMGILNIVASTYSQLVAIDSDGNETILYDVNNMQFMKTVTICIVVIVVVFISLSILVRQTIKGIEENLRMKNSK